MANYLVATFSDRREAETAYRRLESQGFPLHKATLLGSGHKSLADHPLFDPNRAIRQRLQWMIAWLVPFGFFGGFTFNQITQLTIWSGASPLVNGVLGGLMGAVAGVFGSLTIAEGFRLLLPGQDTLTYDQRIERGKYLLAIQGSELTIDQGNRILRSQSPESLQIYQAPGLE